MCLLINSQCENKRYAEGQSLCDDFFASFAHQHSLWRPLGTMEEIDFLDK